MEFVELDRRLRETFADLSLDNGEKFGLREIGAGAGIDRVRYLRNRAFDLARELMIEQPARTLEALHWLEQVVKTLDAAATPSPVATSGFVVCR